MRPETIAAIEAAAAAHEALPENAGRPFSAFHVFEVPAVTKELGARSNEARSALRSAMKGWDAASPDLHQFIGGARGWSVQYQMRFQKAGEP